MYQQVEVNKDSSIVVVGEFVGQAYALEVLPGECAKEVEREYRKEALKPRFTRGQVDEH